MTQEDKELLIKDLCPRLPYGVYVEHINTGMRGHLHDLKVYPLYDKTDDHIYDYICSTDFLGDGDYFDIEAFKPYLFPLSSMSEEQKEELMELMYKADTPFGAIFSENIDYFDWLNKNHFDYRGLIPKGLAIDATGLNIY
jgi:hypothetical protein